MDHAVAPRDERTQPARIVAGYPQDAPGRCRLDLRLRGEHETPFFDD